MIQIKPKIAFNHVLVQLLQLLPDLESSTMYIQICQPYWYPSVHFVVSRCSFIEFHPLHKGLMSSILHYSPQVQIAVDHKCTEHICPFRIVQHWCPYPKVPETTKVLPKYCPCISWARETILQLLWSKTEFPQGSWFLVNVPLVQKCLLSQLHPL